MVLLRSTVPVCMCGEFSWHHGMYICQASGAGSLGWLLVELPRRARKLAKWRFFGSDSCDEYRSGYVSDSSPRYPYALCVLGSKQTGIPCL